jgi:predicted HTH domain antitoxin
MNTAIEIQIPPVLIDWGFDKDRVQRHVLEWMTLSLFTEEHVSSGKAASMLGISRIEFLALLRKRGIAYVNLNEDELAEEFAAVDALTLPDTQ